MPAMHGARRGAHGCNARGGRGEMLYNSGLQRGGGPGQRRAIPGETVSLPLRSTTGDVARLLRECDRAESAFGPAGAWAAPLRVTLELMLHSRTAMFLVWGEARTFLYNDAYLPVLGAKHPAALGRPMQESWAEVWDEVGPLLQRTFSGESLGYANRPFTIVRDGVLQPRPAGGRRSPD